MSKHLSRDIEALEQHLLGMSALVEDMIDKASRALRQRDAETAREVIDSDDEVDQREVQIEEECLKILALHQPVAVDLRRTATILKINNDLERMADLAVNVAERSLRIDAYRDFEIPHALERMTENSISMVRRAIDALVQLDAGAANQVLRDDDEVDEDCVQVIGELYNVMRQHPEQVEPALHCFSATRHIERIADHATNIAEDVLYLIKGDIARHRHNVELSV